MRRTRSRHCEDCGYLGTSGYEYPESYCTCGISEDDPKAFDDDVGMGCTYHWRTLKKKKDEMDHMEYLSMLGYNDYFLMPTMEYTEENIKILEKHRDIVRHSIGLDHKKPYIRKGKKFYRPYRNYFETNEHTIDYPYCERLSKAGIMKRQKGSREDDWIYFVTQLGFDWLGQHDGIIFRCEDKTE